MLALQEPVVWRGCEDRAWENRGELIDNSTSSKMCLEEKEKASKLTLTGRAKESTDGPNEGCIRCW